MKTATKILFINISLIALIIIFSEIFLYYKINNTSLKYSVFNETFSLKSKLPYREPNGLEYKKPPVLIYGCSYAYGGQLEENEHLGYILSELTKRPVYNFGISGMGLQQALYLLQNQEKIEPKPEFLIYVFIQDHIFRMYMKCFPMYRLNHLSFKEKNGKFLPEKDLFSPVKNTMLYQYLYYNLIYKRKPQEEKFALMKKYLCYIKKEADEKYPGIKMVIINADSNNKEEINLSQDRIDQIRQMGIDVINLEDKIVIRNPEYHISKTDMHPNAKVWNEFVPYIIQKENM